jgi:peptidoglycan/xylan/chitin deacetylase (PgdA/CDA1 family)
LLLTVPRGAVDIVAARARTGITSLRSVFWQVGRRQNHGSGIRALFYHRVSDDRDELAVTPTRFREQMMFLAQEGFRVIDIVGLTDLLSRGECPTNVIALSFDDGYLDVAQNALPVLEEFGFSATVFVVTGAADGRVKFSWYRREHPPVMGWDDIVALDRGSPLRFEAHSVTHPRLPALSDDQARAEIVGSRAALEARLGRRIRAFCYPSGLFGPRDRELVAAAGYDMAVSCEPGINTPATDRFALRRIQIFPHDRSLDFRAKVAGAHDSPLFLRDMYRRMRGGTPVSDRA